MFVLPSNYTEVTPQIIGDMIKYNGFMIDRYSMLHQYYRGEHAILQRFKNDTLKNNKLVINHASYIVDTATGYLLGAPVDYVSDYDISAILDCYKQQTINDLDTEIAKNTSIFGIQHEYVYADENAQPRSSKIDNRNCVLAYDNTLDHKKIFGIIYRPIGLQTSVEQYGIYRSIVETLVVDYYDVIYLDDNFIVHYKYKDNVLIELERNEHSFGKTPLIKYRNNSDEIGDFEKVLSLIDAYNILQSDRINDKEQLVDAILCMYEFDFTAEQHELLKESRVLASIPKDGRVEYLTKVLHEADMDILRNNLEQDIHKISMIPNMSDEKFSGNSSGVALRFKLLPFEQCIKNKERYFEKGLMERFELYNSFLSKASRMQQIPIYDVDAVFKRNLPKNDLEISSMIKNLEGLIDNKTLISQLSFVKNADDVMQKTEDYQEKVEKIQEAEVV